MDIRAHVVALNEKRAKAAKELNDHLDSWTRDHPGEAMNEEAKTVHARIVAEIDGLEDEVRRFVSREEREQTDAELRDAFDGVFGPGHVDQVQASEDAKIRDWYNSGNRGDFVVEGFADYAKARNRLRDQGLSGNDLRNALLTDTGSIGSAVPTTMASSLYEYMENSIALFRAPTTKIVTGSGESIEFPKVTTHTVGTQVVAQGTALAGTDPAFDKMTLGAYKYGSLVGVSSEALDDTVFDLSAFLGRNMGRALARDIDADLVVGGGSGAPQGIMGASWGSVATGGSLITVDYENLVDIQYGVADEYLGNSAGWLMNRSTAGALRKLRDGAGGTVGAVLWEPSLTSGIQGGEPDRLLGYPVYTDPNVAAQGSAAKAIWFGDFSSYYVRQVGNVAIARSDDYAFNTDQVYFRAKWRVDGDVIDTAAGYVSHQRT